MYSMGEPNLKVRKIDSYFSVEKAKSTTTHHPSHSSSTLTNVNVAVTDSDSDTESDSASGRTEDVGNTDQNESSGAKPDGNSNQIANESTNRPRPRSTSKVKISNPSPRSFQDDWIIKWPWLACEKAQDGLTESVYCKTCRSQPKIADTASSFYTGITKESSKKTSNFRDHDKSKKHVRCTTAANAPSREQSLARKAVQLLEQKVNDKTMKLFNIAHAIAKFNRPFSDFVWNIELHEKNMADVGKSYRSDKQCATMIHYIALSCLQEVKTWISNCNFVSVMTDGSTNKSVREVELVYIRAAKRGETKVFLAGAEVVDRPNSENILKAIYKCMGDVGLTEDKFNKCAVGFAADGASVNFGARQGVAAQLKENGIEWLIGVHCIAHRLELSIKDAAKACQYQQTVDDFMLNVYLYYHQSSVAR